MSDQSDVPWGELPLRNRARVDRISAVVIEDHATLDRMKQERIEMHARLAQLELRLSQTETTLAVMRAMSQGTGPTTAGS